MSTTERAAIGGAVAPLDTRGPAAGSGAGAFAEAARQLTVCNACRYCEGYCAVYPALELRRALSRGDVTYLANLCHDCRACYYACMYAPPHEFGINIPQALAEVRHAGYQRHARPRAGAGLFAAMPEALAAGAVAAVVVGLALWLVGPARMLTAQRGAGAFYRIVPYWAIVIPGLALCCYWLGVWAAGARVFWRDIEMRGRAPSAGAAMGAAWDVLVLRWLRGGGPGCPYPDEHPSRTRALLHSLVFYGFLAATASTTIAAIDQDLLGRLPPYALTSAPVILGTAGGVAMILGTVGMLIAKGRSDRQPASGAMTGMEFVFVLTLGLASLTGLLTLALRSTGVLGPALVIHLAIVAALFVTAPYGKFVHAIYRYLALVRRRMEQDGDGRPAAEL